jgi:hypothetical protein
MTNRFDLLSKSQSGLSYVREKRGGVVRALTERELADFEDPKPCPECFEQFGCEHFNSAAEPILTEAEIEAEVPEEWKTLAREEGLSKGDLERLRSIELHEGEYRPTAGVSPDVRTLELLLLLNAER